MSELAVTNTHGLLWAVRGERRRLGRAARRIFERADAADGTACVYVPVLALVELSEGAHAGRIQLAGGFGVWIAGLFASPYYQTVDLTREIVLRAETLYGIPERTDRLIAATARELGFPLITRDPHIRRIAGIETIW